MSSPTEVRPVAQAVTRRRSRLADWWRDLTLRDAVLVTSLPALLVLGLFVDAALRFSRAIQFDDWWGDRASVPAFFGERLAALGRLPARVALRNRLDPEAVDPAIIRLDVARRAWDSMQADPLAMWGEWVDGALRYGATTIPVSLRKRGDNSIHWTTDKRTVTVRTPRDDQYKHIRRFALSVKDVIPAYLANRLAREFDLLAPRTEVAPVFLNNQFYGAFRFSEVVDESMLRPVNRMPGNIFQGDAAERGDVYRGTPRNLFDNPYIWSRAAANDRWTSAGSTQLRELLVDLRGGTFADHQRLMARFDRDELARLFAYLLVVGDPFHMDRVHNEFLYEDPSTQLLHFVPWDIRLRELARPEKTLNDVFQAVLRDPWLVDAVMHEVRAALEQRRIVAVADSLMRVTEAHYHDYLAFDRARVGLVPDVGSTTAAAAILRANGELLRRWLEVDTVAYAVGSGGPVALVDLELRGLVGVDLMGFDFAGSPARPRLHADRNRNGVFDRDDPEVILEVSGGRATARTPVALLPAWSTVEPGVRPGRVSYRLFLTGAGAASVTPILRNRVTGAPAGTVAWSPGEAIGAPSGWHPWRYPVPRGSVIRLAGDVRIDSTLRIPREDTLVVMPGATLRLGPDVSIVARGLVRVEGSAARPIRVVPGVEGRPWGTFALLGDGADGSVVRQVEFIEGGGALVDRIEYIGMVNVHRARNVVFDSVLFRDNRRSDDTFHALHATVALTNSRFVRANSDAVDFDVSGGEIRGNEFETSGGDAIDLMTSSPRIVGNRIRRAGDKGISIGESSSPFIFDNLIEGSPVGIEVKDRSAPVVLNLEIQGTGVGVRSRMKNWRYGGSGFGALFNSRIAAVRPLEMDSMARLTVAGVVGLDSTGPTGAAAPLEWLYASQGIDPGEPRAGRVTDWRAVRPVPATEVLRFEDDFRSVTAGWRPGARITRLEQRSGTLVVEAEGGTGSVSREVDWDLRSRGGMLVLEVAGRDLVGARIVVVGEPGDRETSFEPREGLLRFAVVELSLPPGRYSQVRIDLEPTPGLSHIQRNTGLSVVRAGRLDVRSVAVYPLMGPSGPADR